MHIHVFLSFLETILIKYADLVSKSIHFVVFPPRDHSKISKTVRFFTLPEAALNIDRMA